MHSLRLHAPQEKRAEDTEGKGAGALAMKTLNRIFYSLALLSSWYTAWRERATPLHTARWIYFHELAGVLTQRLSGTQILLGKTPILHGLAARAVAVKPTKLQRELGHVLLVGKHRS